ncbi:MAG: MBG domain-containing protein [Dorea sp.]
MKKMKRWLALVLAIALVSTNAIYQLGTHMSASESSQDTSVSEEQPQQEEQAADSQTQDTTEHTDSGQASVQEVTPDQSATATTKTIAVKIQKSDVDGGTVKVVNADGSKSDVTYDGNNQYAKEVTEGESFGFEVTAKDGYQVEQVTDQNGTAIQPASVNGNVSTYNVTDIRSEKVFSVTYNKVETQTEEKNGEKTENKAEDATATEETEDQNDADTQVTSNARDIHVDTETEKWITVGKSVTLSSEKYQYGNYSHEWSIENDSRKIVSKSGSGSSITVTGLKEGTATVKDKVTWTTGVFWQQEHEDTITYTVHVLAKKSATGITITGANEVTQFKNINLTYTLTPTGAEGTVQWSSSNEDILTVDSSGKVTGLRRGQATVTANVYSGQSLLCSATKTIQVVEDTTVAGDSAIVYYLLDPTKDANSNDSGNWGPAYGTAKVNVTGATWTGGRNCFDNVDQRVVSWPNGTNVVTRDSTAWNQIFNKYKSSVEEQLGVPITEDDVVSITLRPAKISRNNSSTPDLHLDCNVDVNCKRVSIVHYYLLDKSSDPNSTEYVHQGSKSYINGNKTNPETVTGKSFPRTKTGTDGATYTFSGWYTDQELTQPATFPYTVNSNVNFYAKYVAGRQVVYNLDGGSFSDGSSLTEKHNEGENVVVKSEPTRKGYKFTGWTVEGLDGVSSINSGARFQMPNNNVTITANWKEQKIEDFITLTPKDVTEVYNGEAHEAGIATASAKKAEANLDGVKIEYQKADGTWTENPAEITATNVADSTTVKVRVTSENYVGKLEKSEKLTITKRSVTISVANDEKYYGTEDPEFASATMSGQVAGELADVDLRVIRTNASVNKVGTYKDVLTINSSKKELEKANTNYTFTIIPGTFEIKKNDQGALTVSAADVTQTYDGNAYGVAPRASIEGATITYKDANGNYTLTESPTRTDAGQTTVEFKASLEGYADAFGSATITINKRPVEIKAANASKTYGEVDPAFVAATMSGQVTGELIDVDLTVSRSDAGNNTLGTHEDVLSISQSKEALEEAYTNYTFTIKPADFTINENETALTVSAADVTKTYDGTSYGVTAVASIDGATIKYKDKDDKYTLDASPTKKNVGEKEVEFEASLYGYKTVTGKAKITITKRPVTITAANSWKYYGNADPTFDDAIMQNQVAGELTDVDLSVIRSNAQVNKVGTYEKVLTINSSKEVLEEAHTNYTFTINPGTFKIKTNDQNVLQVGAVNVKKTYDGQSLGVEAEATLEGAVIKYKDADGNYTLDESPTRTNVGTTTVEFKASLEGYADAFGSATITIEKRPVEIKAANASKSYGEADPAFASATMSGQVTGELTDVDLTVSRSDAGTEDGEKNSELIQMY